MNGLINEDNDKLGLRPFHILMKQGKKWWLKNFGSADLFFKISLTWWSSAAAPLTNEIYVGYQVGWK